MLDDYKINLLLQRIQTLNNLLAYLVCKDMTITDAAPLLDRLGMEPKEIANIMNSTVNTINVRISESKHS